MYREHVHNYIIFNSTDLVCRRKFRNFLGSSFALRRVSDRICLKHGLSVIADPKPSRGHYGKWMEGTGADRPPSFQERLRIVIDLALEKSPVDFDAFLAEMGTVGYEVKRGRYLGFRATDQTSFTRY